MCMHTWSDARETHLFCVEYQQKDVGIVIFVLAKLKDPRTQIYMDLMYIDPQARALTSCFQVIKTIVKQNR